VTTFEVILLDMEIKKILAQLLFDSNASVVFSTYKANKVVTIGSLNGTDLHKSATPLKKPMGIAVDKSNIAIACLDRLHFFSRKVSLDNYSEMPAENFDSLYLHRAEYNTSILDLHDIHFGHDLLWGINTVFSCLCTFDINYSFIPKWKPNFISKIVPEDRCHLNGLVLKDGVPKYSTSLSKTDFKEGWRANINKSGILMEIPSSRIIAEGLSMPHSPMLIDGDLYILESGIGRLIKVDTKSGAKTTIHDFNRFVRGMTYINGVLIIGMSKIRKNSKTFSQLSVSTSSDIAGLILFNLRFGDKIGEIDLSNSVDEIYDVKVINGTKNPAIIPKDNKMSKEIITMPKNSFRVTRNRLEKN
jgi:uncharacterized protein (TIGR03032 family)